MRCETHCTVSSSCSKNAGPAPSWTLTSTSAISTPNLGVFGGRVGGSGLGADAVVDPEQATGIVAVLDPGETGVVVAPERRLPVGLEVVGFRQGGGGALTQGVERGHGGAAALAWRRPWARSGSWPAMPG